VINGMYDFLDALKTVSNKREQNSILFIEAIKKSTDMASLAQRRTAEPNRVCVLIRVFLRELNVIVDRTHMRPFWNEAPVLLSLRRSNEYRVYETNSLYSKKRTV